MPSFYFTKHFVQSSKSLAVQWGRSTGRAANMLAAILIALADHNATAPSSNVPALAAPAAVPAPIPRFVGACWQWALKV